jgi:hypothetical protein
MSSLTAGRRPLTVAEALRNIAAEEMERRRLESAQHHADRLAAEAVLHPLHELQQDRAKVLV